MGCLSDSLQIVSFPIYVSIFLFWTHTNYDYRLSVVFFCPIVVFVIQYYNYQLFYIISFVLTFEIFINMIIIRLSIWIQFCFFFLIYIYYVACEKWMRENWFPHFHQILKISEVFPTIFGAHFFFLLNVTSWVKQLQIMNYVDTSVGSSSDWYFFISFRSRRRNTIRINCLTMFYVSVSYQPPKCDKQL